MITAIDSNILFDIIQQNDLFAAKSIQAIRNAHDSGVIVICDVVYAEVCAAFLERRECDTFLQHFQIRPEPLLPDSSFSASRMWLSYLKIGGKRSRVLPDFLIAAHATNQADALLTRDRGFYRTHFPGLKIIDPAKS